MKKLFALLFFTTLSFSQELPNFIPPSPTVAGLMHFEELPIDYYSGQPDIQIPIYSKSIGSGVSIPIALKYHTLGLRVDERSGWVGTGWSLDGEAVISRTVRGIRDEANDTGNFNINERFEVGVYHNGFFEIDFKGNSRFETGNFRKFQKFLWNSGEKGSGTHPLYKGGGVYDKELDLYQLSLYGHSARFVIIKNASNALEVKMLNNPSNLKVTPNYNTSSFTIRSFNVTDTNGIKYLMDIKEESNTSTFTMITSQYGPAPNPSYYESNHVSAWKVKEIRNVSNQQLATYSYQPVLEKFEAPISFVKKHVADEFRRTAYLRESEYPVGVPQVLVNYNRSMLSPKYSSTRTTITLNSQKVQSIVFRDQSKINFKLNANKHPEYIDSGSILDKIEIRDPNNRLFKRYDFVYSGINSTRRLFLDKMKEYFKTDTNVLTYTLNYKNKEKLPSALENSNDKDLWGYYRKSYHFYPNSIILYRLPKKSADKNLVDIGSLTSISYPTGGIKEFNFESNTFSHTGVREFTDKEFKNYNQDNWDWNPQNGSFSGASSAEIMFDNDLSNPILNDQSIVFTITDKQTVQYKGKLLIGNSSDPLVKEILGNVFVNLEKVNADDEFLEKITHFGVSNSIPIVLEPGRYRLSSTSYYIPSGGSPNIKVRGVLYFKKFKDVINKSIYGGGLRIGSIAFKDASGNVKRQINYTYNHKDDQKHVIFNNNGNSGGNQIVNDKSGVFTIRSNKEVTYTGKLEIGDINNTIVKSIMNNVNVNLERVDINDEFIENIASFNLLRNRSFILQPGRYRLSYTSTYRFKLQDPDIIAKGTIYFKGIEYYPVGPGGGGSGYDPQDRISSGTMDGFLTNIKEYTREIVYTMYDTIKQAQGTSISLPSVIPHQIDPHEVTIKYNVKENLNSIFASLTKGNFVGYRKVTVSERLNGKSVYEYTSPVDFPTYPNEDYFTNYPFVPRKEKSHLHGALINQSIYNRENQKLKEIINSYKPVEILQAYSLFTYDTKTCPWFQFYSLYQNFLDLQVSQNRNPPIPFAYYSNCEGIDGFNPINHYYTRYLLNETVSKDYSYDDSDNATISKKKEAFSYDPSNYLISEKNTYYTESNAEQHEQTKYFYPLTANSSYPSSRLSWFNRINEIIGIESYKNDKRIATIVNQYSEFDTSASSDITMLEKVRTLKGEAIEEPPSSGGGTGILYDDRIIYHDYDNYGNPLEVSKIDGTHIAYIWGYDQQYPIAKIENATRQQIEALPGFGADFHSGSSGLTTAQEHTLRTYPSMSKALITTYSYKPMIGMTKTTDPRGYTMYYEYDEFNRLQKIKDASRNILSENEYHYKNN